MGCHGQLKQSFVAHVTLTAFTDKSSWILGTSCCTCEISVHNTPPVAEPHHCTASPFSHATHCSHQITALKHSEPGTAVARGVSSRVQVYLIAHFLHLLDCHWVISFVPFELLGNPVSCAERLQCIAVHGMPLWRA